MKPFFFFYNFTNFGSKTKKKERYIWEKYGLDLKIINNYQILSLTNMTKMMETVIFKIINAWR